MQLDHEFFVGMPKAETHLHLDGSLYATDIDAIAAEEHVIFPYLPEQTVAAIKAHYQMPFGSRVGGGPHASEKMDHFLHRFDPAIDVMQTPKGLQEAAFRHVRNLAAQKYVYGETRFAPQYHTRKGLSLHDVIANVLKGLDDGHEDSGTRVRLIISIGREMPPEFSPEIAKAALEFQDQGVVGIDLACNEIAYPPELHVAAYQLTVGSQLRRTVHAGEMPGNNDGVRRKNIQTALNDLKADGLGHAVPLAYSPELLQQVKERGTRIESCPLSNQIMSFVGDDLRWLKLDELLREGVPVTLNTDDPGIFGNNLATVYEEVVKAYLFDFGDIRQLVSNAVNFAFCSDEEKAIMRKRFRARGLLLINP